MKISWNKWQWKHKAPESMKHSKSSSKQLVYGQRVSEKMLHVTHHQGNANQNHKWDARSRVLGWQLPEEPRTDGKWRKGSPVRCWWEWMWISTAAETPAPRSLWTRKQDHLTRQSRLWALSEANNVRTSRSLPSQVHCSVVHGGRDPETV